jgi:hypothetical protein
LAEARNRIGEALGQSRPPDPAPREVARALFHEHLDLAAIRKALGQPSPADLQPSRPPVVPKKAPPAPVEAASVPTPMQAALDERVQALRAAREDEIAAWEQPDADLRPPPQRIAARREEPPARSSAGWRLRLPAALALAGMLSVGGWLDLRPNGDGAPVREAGGVASPATVPLGEPAGIRPGAEASGRPSIGAPRIEDGAPGLAEIRPPSLPVFPAGLTAGLPRPGPAAPPPVAAVSAGIVLPSLAPPALAPTALVASQPPERLSPPVAAPPVVLAALRQPPPPDPRAARPAPVTAAGLPVVAPAAVLPGSGPPLPRPEARVAAVQPARAPTPAGSSRVVVHYAARGGAIPREPLTAALRRAGFERVEWRAVPRTTSRTQIRFFHDGDAGLSDRAAAALGRTGRPALRQDFTHFEPPATRGTVEVWLGD